MPSSRSLALFTKPAHPGRVKTRLIGALSPERAALLHAAFLGDLAERLRGRAFELRLAWALAEGEEPPREPPPAETGWLRQRGADLGERLFNGLADLARDFATVAAVGSDHPELEAEVVEAAFAALEGSADVVFGPAEDGGYYLVGVRAEVLSRRLFGEVPWSTSSVLQVSLQRCDELDLEVELLPPGKDVDTPADLEGLRARLAAGATGCPRTVELLDTWGWLSKERAR